MWKLILFAHDFSTCAERAEPMVGDLARTLCARVVVSHVAKLDGGLSPGTLISPPGESGPVRACDFLLSHTRERLETVASRLRRFGITVDIDARLGETCAGVLIAAREYRADVIAMGTHGRGGLEHLLLGSVAESVLRQAEVPVITLRNHAKSARLVEEEILADERSG